MKHKLQITLAVTTSLVALAMVFIYYTLGTASAPLRSAQVVPQAFAEVRGATNWSAETRAAFAQDPDNLMFLSRADVEERQGRGPTQWLPPLAQCRYISKFVEVLNRYELDKDSVELNALVAQRQRCYTQFQ